MKVLITFTTAALCGQMLKADYVKYHDSLQKWKTGAEIGLNMALSGTSPNWSGGAANNLSGNIFFNAFANKKWDHSSWDNVLKINVGGISTQLKDNLGNDYRSTKKNIDNVFFDSKYGYSFNKPRWLSAYAGLNIQTQLLAGYNYTLDSIGREVKNQVSSFMSQGTSMPALGFEAKPLDWLFARIGLGALKQTFLLNQRLYDLRGENVIASVGRGKYVFNEFGFQLQAGFNRDLGKSKQYNIKFNYLGFAPYNFSNSNSPLDSRIDLGFVAKISKYINFNYTLISIFDKDLSRPGQNAWQNSWILGFGFLYKI